MARWVHRLIIGKPNLALNRAFVVVDHIDWERGERNSSRTLIPCLRLDARLVGVIAVTAKAVTACAGTPNV